MNQLKNYFDILNGETNAKFLNADLDELIRKTKNIMENCHLCERRCNVNRIKNKTGWCKAPNRCLISSEFLHYGEEPFLVPSHTIFFMGCNLNCQYCQNWAISNWFELGYEIKPLQLAEMVEIRKNQGARNINFVGGEPTPYLLWILQTLKFLKKKQVNTPIVWNSNFYMTPETIKILNCITDLYLPDFKYGNNICAKRLSKVEKYWEIVTRNLLLAKSEICIRHLVLPNHVNCCSLPILKWIKENFGNSVILNVMGQYTPQFNALTTDEYKEINRCLTDDEFITVVEMARKLGLAVIE